MNYHIILTDLLLLGVKLNMVEQAAEKANPQTVRLTSKQQKECLETANEIVSLYGLTAEFLGKAMAVGVVGDNRAYTPVINLRGPFPGYEILAKLSNELSNSLPITKITYELSQQAQ